MASEADYTFIIQSILCQKAGSLLGKALKWAGIEDVGGIVTLSSRCIEEVTFDDGSPEKTIVVDLPVGLKQLILCFKAYVKMKLDQGISVHEDWQNLVTKSEFQSFRLTGYNPKQSDDEIVLMISRMIVTTIPSITSRMFVRTADGLDSPIYVVFVVNPS